MGGKIFIMKNPKKESVRDFFMEIRDFVRLNGPYEMINMHFTGYRAIPFKILALLEKNKRFVLHAHTTKPLASSWKNKVRKFINRRIGNQFISCGEQASLALYGEKLYLERQIMHIPNSIDVERYLGVKNLDYLRRKFSLRKTVDITIGHVARVNKVKNYEFMIEIMKRLKELSVSFRWIFVGDGDYLETVRDLIADNSLKDYCVFLGRQNKLEEIYPLFDVFTLPSFFEGFPTVAVEAQAAGVPLIASGSITSEIDLGLNMLKFLPIEPTNANINTWVNTIMEAKDLNVPDSAMRLKMLEDKKFTNQASAKLYLDFVEGRVDHYNI